MMMGAAELYKRIQINFWQWAGITAVLIVINSTFGHNDWLWIFNSIFFVYLAVLAVMDYHYMMLYNILTYSMTLLGLIYSLVISILVSSPYIMLEHFAGAFIYGIIFYLLWRFTGGIGGGDVKFGIAIGMWLGLPEAILAMLLGFVLGATGAVIMLCRGAESGARMPFGPYMAAGAYIACCFGERILLWYLGL